MIEKQQLNCSGYQHYLLQRAADSKVTFSEIDTPGWSSMVRTEHTSEFKPRQSENISEDPFMPLLPKDTNQSQFQQKKLGHSKSNWIRYSQQIENFPPQESNDKALNDCKVDKERPQMRLSQKIELRLQELSRQPEKRSTANLTQSSQHSDKSKISKGEGTYRSMESSVSDHSKPNISKIIDSHKRRQVEFKSAKPAKSSRFKQISVHEHLYLTSKKIEQKKELTKIIEEKFENQHVTTFSPHIDPHSNKIAQQLFSSHKNKNFTFNSQFDSKDRNDKEIIADSCKRDDENRKLAKKLFDDLSRQSDEITEETLNNKLEELPLSCIRLLQKIIQKVYSGDTYSQEKFQSALDNKSLIIHKEKLLKTYQHFLLSSLGSKKFQLNKSKISV